MACHVSAWTVNNFEMVNYTENHLHAVDESTINKAPIIYIGLETNKPTKLPTFLYTNTQPRTPQTLLQWCRKLSILPASCSLSSLSISSRACGDSRIGIQDSSNTAIEFSLATRFHACRSTSICMAQKSSPVRVLLIESSPRFINPVHSAFYHMPSSSCNKTC